MRSRLIIRESTQSIDYRAKQVEYNLLAVLEYWIVDPLAQKVTVFYWVEDLYEAMEYIGEALIASPTFPNLQLTAQQVIQAKK